MSRLTWQVTCRNIFFETLVQHRNSTGDKLAQKKFKNNYNSIISHRKLVVCVQTWIWTKWKKSFWGGGEFVDMCILIYVKHFLKGQVIVVWWPGVRYYLFSNSFQFTIIFILKVYIPNSLVENVLSLQNLNCTHSKSLYRFMMDFQ